VIAPEDYCREIEAYLCRKNDGHLIRIVGPAFEQVSQWAREGIPLKVACAGVDRYFERYYRKGPRRWPVRIEFCESDVREAFDDWRRAVGVARSVDAPDETQASQRRSSLAVHIERSVNRLTALRGGPHGSVAFAETLDAVVRRLDALLPDSRRARGVARTSIATELGQMDRQVLDAATAALSAEERDRLLTDAARELEPFRARMLPDAFEQARTLAFERLVREKARMPDLRYE
jgi:hypothetical protein